MSVPTLDEVKRELASRSLHEFVKQAWRVVEPATPFVDGRHIEVICDALQECDPTDTEGIKALLVNIPPRHMKSLLVCVFWPAWLWGPANKPHIRFLFSSYSQQLAIRDNLKCRRLITSPWYQANWGDRFRLTGDQNQKTKYENDKSGYRLVTSPESGATGEGGDVVVCDDPHNVKEAPSETQRQATIEWWDQTMSTRLNDQDRGVFVVIGQRVHEADLSGHLIKQGGYTHICMPAEYEAKHPHPDPRDWRTEDGELLWPERVTAKHLATFKKKLGSYGYAGQFQQRPAPAEGGIFKRAWMRLYDRLPPRLDKQIQYWDMAFKDHKDNSFVCGQVWGRLGADFYLIDLIRGHYDFPASQRAVISVSAKHPQSTGKYVEDKANGPAIISSLRDKIPGLIADPVKGSKEARAAAVSPLFEAGNVHLPRFAPWLEDYIAELCSFPNAADDDQVDATSGALNVLGLKTVGYTPSFATVEREIK